MRAAVVGISGPRLTGAEAAVFRAHPPAGVILFRRNIEDPDQLRALMAELREALPANPVLMVDQEGGRVARLRPPAWRAHPAAGEIGAVYASNRAAGSRAAWLTGALIGRDCREAGFNVVAAPVLDLRLPDADPVIGDRAFGADPLTVAELGRAMADGLLAAGVQPVGKHAPGHGRALADSHAELPCVTEPDLRSDLAPFAINNDLPWMMVAHILYPLFDPVLPASVSPRLIAKLIRGEIGFAGVLVSDDLSMRALTGAPEMRAQAALAAGCDLALECSGDLAATEAVLSACPEVGAAGLARLQSARALAEARRQELDAVALALERDRLLA